MGIHDTIKSAYLGLTKRATDNILMDYKWFAEQEVNSWNHWIRYPLKRRLWLWKHGFPSPFGKLYDLDTHGPDRFISELQRYQLFKSLNGPYRYQIDDKLSQHWMLSEYPDNRPAAYGLIDRGRLHEIADAGADNRSEPVPEALLPMIREHGTLVLKHLRGKGGKEVHLCGFDGEYTLDGEYIEEEALVAKLRNLSGYLVTEFVEQHPYAERLYPHSPNTIRILTMWDNQSGELFVPFACQRIGTERSRPIDNFSVGGLSAEIDLESGTLGSGGQFPYGGEVSWYDTHPDTGEQLNGAKIPGWEEIRSTIEEIARANTHIPAVGWDIILDRDGVPVIIEANTGTGFDMLQIHRPMLDDPRVARIAARHLPEVEPPRDSREGADARRVAPNH